MATAWKPQNQDLSDLPPVAQLASDDVILWNYVAGSALYSYGFFGKALGERKISPTYVPRPFVLSYFDTLYLLEHGIIRLVDDNGKLLSAEEFREFAKDRYEDFETKYYFYRILRKKQYVPRPGMKFGSDFIVYSKGPGLEHSEWVFHVEKENTQIRAIHVVRAGRLAASVRKKYMIAVKDEKNEGNPKFYMFERIKI
ncbi:MAG: tRNA-intron lyase [Methanobacteriota archaeon]|nr:MAG: tRNA-intron lyase [Euryarchaeota archaeon]